MKKKEKKKVLSTSAKKIIEDQKFINEYLRGNKTLEELIERGIKFSVFK